MTKEQAALEKRFEAALKESGEDKTISLAKPYMFELSAGYDSAYTNFMLRGFMLGKDR